MHKPLWQVIFAKEFGEVLRDQRTRTNVIIMPLLILPLMFGLISSLTKKQMKEAQREIVPVAFVGVRQSPTLSDVLKGPENMKVTEAADRNAAESLVREHKVRAALIFPPDSEEAIKESRQIHPIVLAEQGQQAGQEAATLVKALLDRRGARLVALKLQENGLPQELATPFAARDENIKNGAPAGMLFLTIFLPYILALYAVTGGSFLANDTVAGEKERGTLETLLVSPASRREIVTGKFLAVAAASMLSGVLSIIGLFISIKMNFSMLGNGAITLSPGGILAMVLVQVPLAAMGAGLLLTVSTFARNQREAQTYVVPVMLLTMFGAMATLLLKSSAPLYWAAVPITNAALVLKQVLEGTINPAFIAVACATSLLYAAAAVGVAAYAFHKESILLKSS